MLGRHGSAEDEKWKIQGGFSSLEKRLQKIGMKSYFRVLV